MFVPSAWSMLSCAVWINALLGQALPKPRKRPESRAREPRSRIRFGYGLVVPFRPFASRAVHKSIEPQRLLSR